MPTFDPSAPRIGLKILGHAVTAPAIYAAGHALTENEAKFLNRQLATAVANPIPSTIKAGIEKAKKDGQPEPTVNAEKLQAYFNERFTAYEVGVVTRTVGEAADPVDRIVRNLATDWLNNRLKAKGKNINEVRKAKDAEGNSVYDKLLKSAIDANPQFRELAQLQLEALGGGTAEDDFDLGDLDTAEAGPDTTAGADTTSEVTTGEDTQAA